MDEDLTIQTAEEPSRNVVSDFSISPDPAPEPAPEPVKDEVAERLAALEKREKELQKGFDEIARRERQVSQAPAPAPKVEDDLNLDPEAQKLLDKYYTQKLQPFEMAIGTLLQDTMESEVESYAKSQNLEPDAVLEVIRDKQLTPQGVSRRDRQQVYELAAAYVKSNTAPDIESLVNQKVEERLKELADSGATVAGAPQAARVEPQGDEAGFNEDWPAEQKMAFWEAKGWFK